MVAVIRYHETGGPEVLRSEDVALSDPGAGEVRLRQTAIGLNFIDTYFRTGLYKTALPAVPGNEAAGVVAAIGPDVSGLTIGDRVAYGTVTGGAYATERNIEARHVLKLPDGVDDRTAAAGMLKGMTAQYLLRQSFRLEAGHTILVHAAAGGVGQILCQWANHIGATVIGTVGSRDKAELAEQAGCRHVILYREQDFATEVRRITGGGLCDAVYDGVGKATYPASLDCLKPRGVLVSFGNASGAIENFNLLLLSQKGSLYVTRPTLGTFTATRSALEAVANDLFEVIASGAVKVPVRQAFQLAEAQQAHRALESRQTTGASILVP